MVMKREPHGQTGSLKTRLAFAQGPDLLPSLVVAACGAAWGTFWFPLRWLADYGVGSAWVSLVFSVTGIIVPLPWIIRGIIRRPTGLEQFATQMLTGLLIGFGFTLYILSLAITDVLHAILLFYLTPVWSTLIACIIFGEKLSWSRGLAIAAGFLGMALILGMKTGLPLPQRLGDWLALASGLLWAIGTTRSQRKPTSQIALPAFAFAVGGTVTSLAALVIADATGSSLAGATRLLPAMPLMVGLALVLFVPPNVMVLWASQRLDSGRVGILLMTEVMVGAVTSAIYSGEPFGLVELAGTALIICAGLVEVLARRDQVSPGKASPGVPEPPVG